MLDRLRVVTLLFVCVAAPLAAAANAVPEIAVQPIPDEVLHGCDGHKLDELLKQRLGHARRFRLAAHADTAALTLEITNCTQKEQRSTTGGEGGGPIFGPAGNGLVRGTQREGGIAVQSDLHVVLEARLGSVGRSVQVSTASSKDRNLREALDSVRKELDRVLAEKGDWLLHTSP